MPRFAGIILSLTVMFSTAHALPQAALMELYGEGVHRYFAGDLQGAEQLLTRVIEGGSEDARAYYFRGLTHEALGGSGIEDFEAGAMLEAENTRMAVDVGSALTRIQGSLRGKIEKARRDARVVAAQKRLAEQRARLDAAPDPAPAPAAAADLPPAAADPFAGEGTRSPDTTVDAVQPTPPEVDSISNPFADDPAPAATPATPADDAPAADPFGTTPAPAADDPFGTPAGGTPLDDPFGN